MEPDEAAEPRPGCALVLRLELTGAVEHLDVVAVLDALARLSLAARRAGGVLDLEILDPAVGRVVALCGLEEALGVHAAL